MHIWVLSSVDPQFRGPWSSKSPKAISAFFKSSYPILGEALPVSYRIIFTVWLLSFAVLAMSFFGRTAIAAREHVIGVHGIVT